MQTLSESGPSGYNIYIISTFVEEISLNVLIEAAISSSLLNTKLLQLCVPRSSLSGS